MKAIAAMGFIAMVGWNLVSAGGPPASPSPGAPQSLERALLKRMPALIKTLQDRNYKNVGVLKFQARYEGQEEFGDSVGTLNVLLARRLELALVLANDPKSPVGIIADAGAAAQKTKGANHLTAEGRRKLFESRYPLTWGNKQVEADAFLTGEVTIAKDLKTLTVALQIFDRKDNKLLPVLQAFRAANRADYLSEMGASFALRGPVKPARPDPEDVEKKSPPLEMPAVQAAALVKNLPTEHPAKQKGTPVTLQVYYGDTLVPYDIKGDKAYIPEPQEGQTVSFRLARDKGNVRYGAVLKINGENTIDKERRPDPYCRPWVLEPEEGPWWVEGYLLGNGMREKFQGFSSVQSRELEVNYDPTHLGTITLTVFPDAKDVPKTTPKDPRESLGYDAVIAKVLMELPTLEDPPRTHADAVKDLLAAANQPKGLIGGGARDKIKVREVAFRAAADPIMSLTVFYYKKQK